MSQRPYTHSPLGAAAQRFCRPLYRNDGRGGFEAYASCTLVSFSGNNYILQCFHSLIDKGNRISPQYILIDNDFFPMPQPILEDEHIDYAISPLSLEISNAITTLNFASILPETFEEPNYGIVLGFPATRMKNYHKTKANESKMEGAHPLTGNPLQNSGKYFQFQVRRDDIPRTKNMGWFSCYGKLDNLSFKLPRLNGISGGPIFVANKGKETNPESLSTNFWGILTGVKESENLIIGVSAAYIYEKLIGRIK